MGLAAYRNQKPEIIIKNLDLIREIYTYIIPPIQAKRMNGIIGFGKDCSFSRTNYNPPDNKMEQFQARKDM